ncbi:glycerol-3-phosphate dehydrogenase [Roseomonas rosea]|uniref:Glycerol-3-phosphate dehydrogenase n=1 Tax=Muricoccus roseus TaxID=198092 RepID=A0A1M6G8N0_9PROT|nr:glycerol-3-phosphate dehydrogenase [Roseomonas rosea]SHJ06345.1 glycerol-3-phosphate dehydrogenase [Roseomonas rosea]
MNTPQDPMGSVDLLVIGGGVNGCGIARDAAGRGLSVMLVEKGDIAEATSSSSSKLIHGGIRYLETYEFRLVREALAEREVLLGIAPHIVWPMRFVLPHRPEMRPRWMIRAGLFLYDHLARRVSLPGSEALELDRLPQGEPLRQPQFSRGFAYSDCWVEDSRLVLLNARDAADRGATILPRTSFETAQRGPDGWSVTLRHADGTPRTVRARAIANAAGPWVTVAQGATGTALKGRVRLVRGSHIVVPALYQGSQAYILQNDDRRVVFVIPYEERFSLIGTTDVPHDPAMGTPHCTPEEAAYLCEAVSRQFRNPVTPDQITWTYSGVRPLHDDGSDNPSAVTRDYTLSMDTEGAPLLTVLGGKITTYRRLAEDATGQITRALGRPGTPWTGKAALPGGDLGGLSRAAFTESMARAHPWLDRPLLDRLIRTHGSLLERVIDGATSIEAMGGDLGGGITARELEWMRAQEWVAAPDDVLWRRTKRGLHMTPAEREAFAERFGGLAAVA